MCASVKVIIGISVVWSVVVDVVVVWWVVLVDGVCVEVDGSWVEVDGSCVEVDGSWVEVDGLCELVDGLCVEGDGLWVVLLVMGLVVDVVVGDLVLGVGFGVTVLDGTAVLVVGGEVVVVVVLSGFTGHPFLPVQNNIHYRAASF